MAIELAHLFRRDKIDLPEYNEAAQTAGDLVTYLNKPDVLKAIALENQHGLPSQNIQNVFLNYVESVGFRSEARGLFSSLSLKPDYYRPIGDSSGIIMEVERGKTLANNMDMLDMWKCHICGRANYLILIVPSFRYNGRGEAQRVFAVVRRRLEHFFQPENYTNVFGVWVLGY